jgi:ABC-type molybdate transport system substrate-binding protein
MESGQADIFLTYCTNAVLAQREVPGLKIVAIPAALAVGADYGLMVLDGAPSEAWRLALHIVSPAGQKILAGYGFESSALPSEKGAG